MRKQEFLERLRVGLAGLPPEDVEERLIFYSEMLDDRMEEGLSEEEAVGGIGSVDEIVTQIVADTPLSRLVREKITPKKRLKTWEIVLLAVGSPVWFSLLIAVFAVLLSLYVVLWALLISLWAVLGSMVCCALFGVVTGVVSVFLGRIPSALAFLGTGLVCAGLSVFLFFGCRAASKGTFRFTKQLALRLKNAFLKKEEA